MQFRGKGRSTHKLNGESHPNSAAGESETVVRGLGPWAAIPVVGGDGVTRGVAE